MDDDFKILLDAGLDQSAKQNVQSDLNNIKDLQATIQKLNLSPEAIASLKQSLQKNGINLDVLVNVHPEQVRQAQQVGQQIGQQINEGIKNAVQKGTFETKFKVTGNQNDIIGKVKEQFQQIKELANSTISVKEIMQAGDKSSMLDGFIVQIKQANGLVEELKYSFDKLDNAFVYTNGTINENGIIKQINATENAISSYKQKVAQFKSTNESILSGIDFTQFNNAMQALENGTGSIEAVKTAYRGLGTQTASITQELTGQLNKAGKAVRDIAKGDETIASLKADFNGLSNAPKEVTTQLNGLSTKLTEIKRLEDEEGRNANWAKAYKAWREEVDVLTAKLRVLQKEQANMSSSQVLKMSDLKKANRAYISKVGNTVDKNSNEVAKMANAHGWQDWDITGIERADGMVKQLTVTFTDATGAIKRFVMQRDKLLSDKGNEYSGLVQVGDVKVLHSAESTQKAIQEKANTIFQNASAGKNNAYQLQIDTQIAQLQKYGYTAEEAKNQVSQLTEQLRIMASADSTAEQRVQAEQKFSSVLAETKVAVANARLEYQGLVTEQSRLAKANSIESFLQKNTRITAEARAELQRYIDKLRDTSTAMSRVEKSNIDVKFQSIQNSMRGLNKLGYSLADQLKQAAGSFTQWLSVSSLVMTGVSKTREAVNELIEMDNILTEISKTSDLTDKELKELGKSSFDKASELGRTATDYLNTVTEMSRSGFYGEQSEAMAKQVLLAQTAGDLTNDLASKYVLATNAAYKFNGEASKLNEVIDGMNMVTNRNSVAMEDMAESMSTAGSVAATYRVDPAEFAAMTGTIEAVTKLGGSEVGTGIKSLLINLQNVNSSKITGTLKSAGAAMTEMVDGAESLRKPMDILRDLSKTFKTLDEDNPLRAEILTNIGGKYQATKLAALLDNFEMYDKMLQDYSEGHGSAMQEAEKSASNVTGSLNKLSNTWTKTINNLVNSDGMIAFINLLEKVVSLVDKITDNLGLLGTGSLIGSAIAGAKGKGLTYVTYHSLRVPYCI